MNKRRRCTGTDGKKLEGTVNCHSYNQWWFCKMDNTGG